MSFFPTVETFTNAGRTIPAANLQYFMTRYEGVATGNGTFVEMINGVVAGYQVPVGKTLRIIGYRFQAIVSNNLTVGYADNDVGVATGTAFVNPVYMGGISAAWLTVGQPTPEPYQEIIAQFDVPAGKYPFVTTDGDTARGLAMAFGYLY